MRSESSEPCAVIEWRGHFENSELNLLHAECFEHTLTEDDWWSRANRFSLGWVCMRQAATPIGFANVAWDGNAHAFLLDTMITGPLRRKSLATALVKEAVARTKDPGGK